MSEREHDRARARKPLPDSADGLAPGRKSEEIAKLVEQQKSLLDEAAAIDAIATAKKAAATAKQSVAHVRAVSGLLLSEKTAFEKLAKTLEKQGNWKGNNQGDAKLAADALRALPVARKLLTFITEVRGRLPDKVPDPDVPTQRGYSLAVHGIPAPGPQGALDTAGRILGAIAPMDAEIQQWSSTVARMESVAHQLGVDGL